MFTSIARRPFAFKPPHLVFTALYPLYKASTIRTRLCSDKDPGGHLASLSPLCTRPLLSPTQPSRYSDCILWRPPHVMPPVNGTAVVGNVDSVVVGCNPTQGSCCMEVIRSGVLRAEGRVDQLAAALQISCGLSLIDPLRLSLCLCRDYCCLV